jgi:mannitol-1-/sugar-/sorbitol-6-phosphatase
VTRTIPASAILFDMDGTLVDSSGVVDRVWSEWAVAHGLDPEAVLEVARGRQSHETMAILLPARTAEETHADNLAMVERETSDLEGVVEIVGAGDLLRSLAGTPHALVTSAVGPLARARMETAGLTVPAVAVTAEHVSASKPDPEGFLAAAAALGVAPADCVVFEDSAAGIAAGRSAGMRVVGVGADAARHGADWVVADLSGVRVSIDGDALEIAL